MRNRPRSDNLLDDPQILMVLCLTVVLIVGYVIITKYEVQISSTIMLMSYYLLKPVHYLVNMRNGEGLDYFLALQTGQLPQKYSIALELLRRVLVWYSPFIIGWMGWLIWRSRTTNIRMVVSGELSRDDIWAINAYNFTSTLPSYGRNIEKEPLYTGPWRLPFSPVMYCARNGILEVFKDTQWQAYPFDITRSGHLNREHVTNNQAWRINTIKLKEQLKKDLGEPYHNLKGLIALSPSYAALLYTCASRIIFGKEQGYITQDALNRCFVQIREPSRNHPVPGIKPQPLDENTLAKFLLDNKIDKVTLDMIDYNQARLHYLNENITALSDYYQTLRQGGNPTFKKPQKNYNLLSLERQFAKEIKNSLSLNRDPEISPGEGLKWAESEIEKFKQTANLMVDFFAILKSHAYCDTVLYRLYSEASRFGVFTTADFIWLRPINNRLFFSLNNKGRQAAAIIDGAAVHYHALCEMRLGEALHEPQFDALIEGIEYEVKEFFAK